MRRTRSGGWRRCLGGLLTALGLALTGSPALATEEPAYRVVEDHPGFELRRYPPLLVAEVDVEGDFDDVGGRAFFVLARYIGGENRGRREIAMTAPVTQEPAGGEEIAMTAPVTQQPAEDGPGGHTIAFVMPGEFTRETLPEPTDPRVRIREQPARTLAVRRYSGFWSESRFRRQERALRRELSGSGWRPTGPAVYARYDPPFTLWFLRRNEVWLEVERD